MRKFILFLVIFSFIAILSCGYPSTPKDVVSNFFASLKAEKYEEAKKYATDVAKNNIDFQNALSKFKGITDWDYTVPDFAENADEVTSDYIDFNGNTQVISLVKQNNKWLVDQFTE